MKRRMKAAAGETGSASPTLRQLFTTFFKIGLFTFGGGFAMIPLIHREMVERRRWIADTEIVDVLALAQSIPGAVAINAATLIGRRLRGNRGGLSATAGVILPSFGIITLIAMSMGGIQHNPVVQAAFLGLRPAVVALLVMAVWKVGKASVKAADGWGILLAGLAAALLGVSAIWIVLGSVLIGLVLYALLPAWRRLVATEGAPLLPDEDRNMEVPDDFPAEPGAVTPKGGSDGPA